MKIHLAGNNPYPGIILIRLYESWIGERLGKIGGGYLTTCISENLNRIPLKEINKDAMRIFLAGGIDETNVKRAISQVAPDVIDLSSAVEKTSEDGTFHGKDPEKIRTIVTMVHD